ncbi:MAG: sulfotransferase family 2 domain-containing protein, partial [Pseudomonadota bacterium]
MRLQRTISNSVKGAVFRSGCGQQYTNLWWMMRARSVSPWVDWNVEKNAVFIHVPKNAGTSLYKILEITEPSETHCTALGYRSSNPRLWSQAYTFAFCRNPWDRFVSAFHYLKHKPISADDEAWSKEVLGPFETFADFAEEMDRPSFRSAVFMWR